MTTVLVTGANGFVGKILCTSLSAAGYQVKAAVRNNSSSVFDASITVIKIADIDAQTDWQAALAGVDMVVHLAARVHVMHETADDVAQAFRIVNTHGTENLAAQAAAAGVQRFLFLSTIKVLGEHSGSGVFTRQSPVAPVDAYAISKWQGEQALQKIAKATGMGSVIIRPPLIYGPGVKGNFLRLMQLIHRQIPLPFAAIDNQRSLVYVENICDLIRVCLTHPAAAGQTWLVADADAFSTPQLMTQLANALAVKVRLWFFPRSFLKILSVMLGKQAEVNRLCDSLRIDATQTCQLLNWQPPFSAIQAIAKTADGFLGRNK